MMDCNKAAHLIDRKDFEQLNMKDKLYLRMHSAICGNCRGYNRFSHVLKSLFGKVYEEEECLSGNEKEEMKKKLSSN